MTGLKETVEHNRLLASPDHKPRYTLVELLAASDYSQPISQEEREWVDAPSVGYELL